MTTIACMGGWQCTRREKCRLYDNRHASLIAERLCEPGRFDSYEPIRIYRPAGTWERGGRGVLAPAAWTEPIH